jgi:hypothetical protein
LLLAVVCRSWSSLCSFRHSCYPVTSYTQISTSTSYSQSLSAHVFPSVWENTFHTHINTTGEMILVVLRILTFVLFWIATW